MGKKKIAKKTTTDKQKKMPTPRVARTQQNLKQEKRVRSREILEKEEPKEPPRKTRALGPPGGERMLTPPANLNCIHSETDPTSRESKHSVSSPRIHERNEKAIVDPIAGLLQSVTDKNVSIDNYCKTPSSRTNAIKETMQIVLPIMEEIMNHQVYTCNKHAIGDAIKVMHDMAYFGEAPGGPLYLWLIRHLCDYPLKMDVFVELPDDTVRMKFIKTEHTAAMVMAETSPSPYGPPPPLD